MLLSTPQRSRWLLPTKLMKNINLGYSNHQSLRIQRGWFLDAGIDAAAVGLHA